MKPCSYCTRPHDAPTRGCEPCLERRRNAMQALYEAREGAGLCLRCTAPAHPGQTLCDTHRAYMAKYRPRTGKPIGRPAAPRCDEYVRLWHEHKSVAKIRRLVGVSYAAVQGALERRGIHTRAA